MRRPKVLAVSGEKNTGKTTLIAALLPKLAARGLRVAVIKHDGHSFTPDVPGTDTHRFLTAGAVGAAVYDAEKYMLTKREPTDELALCAHFPQADLILLEGLKHSPHPKLILTGDGQVSCSFASARRSRDDVEGVLRLVLDWYEGGQARD